MITITEGGESACLGAGLSFCCFRAYYFPERPRLAIDPTVPAWRRRGYARAACAAWACGQFDAGRVPFYNHPVRNLASAALARSLGPAHLLDGA